MYLLWSRRGASAAFLAASCKHKERHFCSLLTGEGAEGEIGVEALFNHDPLLVTLLQSLTPPASGEWASGESQELW